jgi:hypothetical protein
MEDEEIDIYPEYLAKRILVEKQLTRRIKAKVLFDRFVPVRSLAFTISQWMTVLRKACDNSHETHFFVKFGKDNYRVTYIEDETYKIDA